MLLVLPLLASAVAAAANINILPLLIHSFIANVFPKLSHNNEIQYLEKENAEVIQLSDK